MANLAQQRLARANAAMGFEPALSSNETELHDIVNDPITHRLMASDGVERDHLMRLLGEARAKMAKRPR
jgi:hypothetical protein